MRLKSGTFLSPIQNRFFHATWAWLAAHSNLGLEGDPSQELADSDVLFMCGLPTGREADRFHPLVAPVLAGERYRGQPIYFSDLVVRPGSSGPPEPMWRIAYNHRESFSGWTAPRSGLAALGVDPDSVTWIATGSHAESLEAVLTGVADAAGIDSMVLDLVDGAAVPGRDLVTVESFGPWPAPPISTQAGMDEQVREELAGALASMHKDPAGARVLSSWGVDLLAPVDAAEYRRMAQFAEKSGSR